MIVWNKCSTKMYLLNSNSLPKLKKILGIDYLNKLLNKDNINQQTTLSAFNIISIVQKHELNLEI